MSEIELLRKHAKEGAEVVASLLGRSEQAVWSAAHRYRISLRRRGERRGKILGEHGAWASITSVDAARLDLIRSEVLDGLIDVAVLEQRIRAEIDQPDRPICPSCAQRPQERSTTGLCEVCHLRELARQHRDEVERREARRELWQARQDKHRRRKKAES